MISNFYKSNRTVGGSWEAKINNNLVGVFYELHYVKLDLVIYQITYLIWKSCGAHLDIIVYFCVVTFFLWYITNSSFQNIGNSCVNTVSTAWSTNKNVKYWLLSIHLRYIWIPLLPVIHHFEWMGQLQRKGLKEVKKQSCSL